MAVETFPTERVSDRATGVTVATSTRASGCWSRRALLLTGRTPMTLSRTAAPTRKSERGAILLPEDFAVLELAIFVFIFDEPGKCKKIFSITSERIELLAVPGRIE